MKVFISYAREDWEFAERVFSAIEKDEYGYYAYCPELPGCQSQGDTFEEITANIREATELYLETLISEEKILS